MKVDVKYLENGTATFVNSNGTTMYQCHYCESWFVPKRRFMQKFCCESCRVMACKKRKSGLYGVRGGNIYDRNKTTNTELYNQMEDLRAELKKMKENNKEANFDAKLQLAKIKRNQDWHIFLTCTMPLVAPTLSKAISNLFSNNRADNLDDFAKKVDPLLKNAPEELKTQIIDVATNYFKNQGKEDKYKSTQTKF
jgi:hypothetical protein